MMASPAANRWLVPVNPVFGATLNKTGSFRFRVTKVGADTMLSQIVKLVEDAQGSRAPIQRLADKVSAIFVPTVVVIALLTDRQPHCER